VSNKYRHQLTCSSEPLAVEAQQAMSSALVDFVRAEWVDGPRENGQTCKHGASILTDAVFRNKLAFTITHLFLGVYPSVIPSFLHPFLELLHAPDPSSPNFDPPLLVVRILYEIAQEIHDTTMRTARVFSTARQHRDGVIRDAIRSTGDERIAVDGLLRLAETSLGVLERERSAKWLELAEAAMKTLASWTRECSTPRQD
jgi:exportin-T